MKCPPYFPYFSVKLILKELYSLNFASGGMIMPQLQTRRSFVKNSMAAAAVLGAPALVSGRNLNDKILMGFIGIGNRGSQLLNIFMTQPDVQVTALCDIYEPFLQRDRAQVDHRFSQSVDRIPPMGESFPKSVKRYHDFRRLLDDKQVDAVCIATPDHWHALQTIAACRAGKDVYIEKPLSITLREGRRMVQVARETNRVVTVGIHRRASPIYQKLVAEILSGKIGHISVASAARINNMMPDG
ncbi:MAG: gfo/Idh/MocA family oxidoreductase, partial [Calditrichaeota bacterium]